MSCDCKVFDAHFEFRHDQRKTVVCSDKSKSEYRYENQRLDNLAKYRVDGGLINDNGIKCDYLLINCDKSEAFFIELKGSDLDRAVKQINRSIELLGVNLTNLKMKINARIVVTRVNTIDSRSSEYLKLDRKIRALGGDLRKESRKMTESNQIIF